MRYVLVEDPKNLRVKCPRSLKQKVYIPKNSNCQYLFTIGKLGESIWLNTLHSNKPMDFVFFDENNRDTPPYNPLNDPHLKDYFHRKAIRDHLRRSHLITDRNEIICSISEYNDLRRCIHRAKAEVHSQQQKFRNFQALMKRQYDMYIESFRKQQKKNERFKKLYDGDNPGPVTTRCLTPKKIQMQEEKRAQYIDDLKKYEERVRKIQLLQKLKQNEYKERGLYRNLELIKKQIYVLEKRKQRRERIKKKIVDREQNLKRRLYNESLDSVNYVIRCPLPMNYP